MAVEWIGMEVPTKFGDSMSNDSPDIRAARLRWTTNADNAVVRMSSRKGNAVLSTTSDITVKQ